jgi:predicted ATPase
MLGYPAQALAQAHEAVKYARDLSLPVTLLKVLFYAARLHQYCREGRIAMMQADEVIVLATEWGLPQWLTSARMLRGWALSEQGQAAEGLSQIHQGWSVYRAMGVKPLTILVPLAEVYGKVGQPEEGLRLLDEGMAAVAHNGGHWCEAELYRRRGELLLQQERHLLSQAGTEQRTAESQVAKAEASVLQALASARRQQAKSWELRAATSLSRLWQQQGKRDEARQLLTEVYGWFTEGFDTADLLEAKALLEQLV